MTTPAKTCAATSAPVSAPEAMSSARSCTREEISSTASWTSDWLSPSGPSAAQLPISSRPPLTWRPSSSNSWMVAGANSQTTTPTNASPPM